jgi:hypothetical protein
MEETTHTPRSPKIPGAKAAIPLKPVLIGLAALVIVGGSFYSGVVYQRSRQPSVNRTAAFGESQTAGFGFRRRMSRSQVTSISNTSITVKNLSGNSKTYSITSSTQIDKNGQSAVAGDIAVGDIVIVVSSDGTTARRIIDGMMGPGFSGANVPNIPQSQLQAN